MTLRQPITAHDRSDDRKAAPASERGHPLVASGAGLFLLAVLTALHSSWAAQVLMVPLLLIVPGVILLRALRVSGETVAAYPIYVPSASLLVLLFSGLAVDLIGPPAGLSAPLRAAPLLAGLEVICVALLASSARAPQETEIPWSSLSRPVTLAWPFLVPLAAAAGALQLNSGHSNHMAVAAVVAVIILLVSTFLFAPWFDEPLLVVILYAAGLAMMWSFSLRGDSVYGFDISTEYYSLHQTVVTGIWHFPHPNDPYGAMLSVTVLPAELHALTGVQDLLVFKAMYPLIGALFPVAVYSLARRVLVGRWAFLAGALVITQQTFFQELPALARQEVATVLFAALITAALDLAPAKQTRWALVCLLSLGMVVSHYSTAYLAIPLLAIAVIIQWAASKFRKIPGVTSTVLIGFLVSLGAAIVWYGPLTHSSSNVTEFVSAAETQGISLLPNQGGNPLSTYLSGESNQEMTPAQYQKYISGYYKTNETFVTPLPDASRPEYALQPASDPTPSVSWRIGFDLTNLAGLLVEQLTNLLAGIAALALALQRKISLAARQVGLIGLGAMMLLVLTRLSGTIAQYYNPQRAFLQSMIVLAIAVSWLFQRLGSRRKRARPAILVVCGVGVAMYLAGQSSLTSVMYGGGGITTNLANAYDDYQQFSVASPEIASAAWVTSEAPLGQLIYGDRYGQLRLDSVAGTRSGVLGDITPETLDQHAWVYASRTNVVDDITRSVSGSYSATYAFPKRFLDDNFDLVYTNDTSEVFHK